MMNFRQTMATATMCFVLGTACVAQDRVTAETTLNVPDWSGVWVSERNFGPYFGGPVGLHRSGDGWVARVQGEVMAVKRSREVGSATTWEFEMPKQGRFVGRQDDAASAIVGHWLQVPGLIENYPFATPVRLERVGGDAFIGEITPFEQEVSLNIPLMADAATLDKGATKYRTFLRNPQRNIGAFLGIESATVTGEGIRFENGEGDLVVAARGTDPGERFTLRFPRFNETLDFTRRERDDAPGFYPRRSPDVPEQLLQPVQTDDGWRTAGPTETGLDPRPIHRLVASLAAFEPTGLRQPYIHGLLVAHRGKLVVEEYFHGHHRDMTHDSRSAGKSVGSALLGIAVQQGALASLDQPIYSLLGGKDNFENPDPRKDRMTVRHLVTMTSGFDCDDNNYENPGNEDIMQNQDAKPDWYQYTLDLPMIREPGEAGVYCTGAINLIGRVVSETTGKSLLRFFQEEFADPLGISYYQMNLTPTYTAYMGGGIRLRPRDFLKLGQLYLDGGVWNGRRLVSNEWVQQSAAAQASINEEDDYGYGWWRRSYTLDGRTFDTHYASGNGGQMLFVVPELELVVLMQAGNYGDGRTRDAFRDRFMQEAFLPAALPAMN